MNRNWLVPALGAALGVSCGTPTDVSLPQLNLDRPVDIAFACYGNMRVLTGDPNGLETDQVIDTAQPAAACDAWSPKLAPVLDQPALKPVTGQGTVGDSKVAIPNWYGFILQSASGTVALATWLSKPSYSSDPSAGATQRFEGGDITVLDADPLTPGKNAISIGEEPIAIATDTSGCYEVTANAGSCDLSVLDINSAIAHADGDPMKQVKISRLGVTSRAGVPIRSRPAAMVAAPNMPDVGKVCPATATGLMYIAYPSCHLVAAVDLSDGMSGKIVGGIKYDSDVPHVMTPAELDALTCPAECASGSDPLSSVDLTKPLPVALALSVTPDLASGAMPPANTMRLAIGAQHSAKVTVVDLDPTTALPLAPQTPAQFPLEDKRGTLGVTAVALSPQIPMGNPADPDHPTDPRNPPGGFGQYVYAVATDNTVRVVDVLQVKKECDTEVDTRFLRDPNLDISKLQCFPVGDATNPPRRVGARGPGIELIGDGVPTSVAIVKGLDESRQTLDSAGELTPVGATPTDLVGYFAIVTASNGRTFVVNIDDDNAPDSYAQTDPLDTTPTFIMAHQLRDALSVRGATAMKTVSRSENGTNVTANEKSCLVSDPDGFTATTGGGPRITAPPTQVLTNAPPVATAKLPELPSLHQLVCKGYDGPADAIDPKMPSSTQVESVISELQFGASNLVDARNPDKVGVLDEVFPDLRSLTSDESWTLTWEGRLSAGGAVDGLAIRAAKMVVDGVGTGMHLLDPSRPFCTVGVEPFDIVNFVGCNPANGDADCPSGYQCFVHPDSKVAIGSCMLKNEASRLANACRDFLISARHYTVGAAQSGELQLLPRKHELRTTPIDGCISDAQCQQLANYAVQNGSPELVDLQPNGMNLDPHTWTCMADDARAPINADPAKNMRCVQTCAYHADPAERDINCDASMICQGATPTSPGICMEGVTPPQACVNGPQRFEVRASEAFTVIGSRSGYIHPIVERSQTPGGMGDTCVRDPAASPLLIGRIPLKAPACGDPATTDPFTGQLAGGGFEANPCSLTITQAENQPNYTDSQCTIDPQNPTKIAERAAPAIQFRNPGLKLTLVDPTYPGDQVCVRDGQGVPVDGLPSVRIPLVFQGYALSFDQKAGFTPLTLPTIAPAFPVKVVRGPTDSIWVIDNGDVLNSTVEATRGQVFRVESTQIGVINTLQ